MQGCRESLAIDDPRLYDTNKNNVYFIQEYELKSRSHSTEHRPPIQFRNVNRDMTRYGNMLRYG